MEARDEKRLLRLQRQLAGYKLLIIDELGYVPLSQTGAELLFEVFCQRYERGSTIVTSNLPFDEWTERVRLRAAHRRAARPADPPRPHPRDERRQLPARPVQAPLTPASSRPDPGRPPSGMNCESKKAPDIGGLLACVVMHFYSGQPMQFRSGVDTSPI